VQVSGITQWGTGVQLSHVFGMWGLRKNPEAHAVHWESVGVVQVTSEMQKAIGVQAASTSRGASSDETARMKRSRRARIDGFLRGG
jgi:hypothetical protein